MKHEASGSFAGAASREGLSLYVFNGLGRRMRANMPVNGDEAFVDAAVTCGLSLFDSDELDPMRATSNGVGACVSHALFHGCKRITVALGSTCTNDGGMGCLKALGIRFFDRCGSELSGCGADLAHVAQIDEGGLIPQVHDAEIIALSDVTNPLLGDLGATRAFGRQKGADDGMLDQLENGMRNFANVIAETHPDVDFDTPGFGAAGGLGMALSVFLGVRIELRQA